jgi:type I restriction enzyme S subunit
MMEELGFRPYGAYKDSYASWLGEVPADWQVGPGRICVYENKDKNTGMKESTVLSLSYGRVIVKDEDKMTGLVPESYETYQIVQPGDIIIRGTDLQNDVTSLRTGLAKDHGIITSAYINLRPKPNAYAEFLHYLLHSYDVKKVFYGLGSGLRQNLSYVDFKYLTIPLPSLPEQRAIVAFLDDKCAKIDGAVKIKEDQIALLRERRQIIIQEAVTRGLNPAAPMKDSGIDWIGQIPAHWEVKKASWYFAARKGGNAADLTKEYCGKFPGQFAVYSGQTENEGVLGRIENFEFDFQEQGCMLCSTVGAKAMTIRFLKERFSLSQNCMIITPRDPAANMEFFSHAFAPIFSYFRNLIPDHMQASFRMEDFYQMKFLLPPVAEQIKILAKIRRTQAKLDGGIAIKHDQIAALKEYKTSLINAAVTGEIKVI